jgi:hypothetical protein
MQGAASTTLICSGTSESAHSTGVVDHMVRTLSELHASLSEDLDTRRKDALLKPMKREGQTTSHALMEGGMSISSRRTFVKQAALLLAAGSKGARPWLRLEAEQLDESVTRSKHRRQRRSRGIVETKGLVNVFKGIPYGDTTAGRNRFHAAETTGCPWKGTR